MSSTSDDARPNAHYGFGARGPRTFCLGAPLARREITVMFREVAELNILISTPLGRRRSLAVALHQRHQAPGIQPLGLLTSTVGLSASALTALRRWTTKLALEEPVIEGISIEFRRVNGFHLSDGRYVHGHRWRSDLQHR